MIHDVLAADHDRLDALLAAALRSDGTIDVASYEAFRGGLLRHIGIEETILFREVRRRIGSTPLIEQLHRDHAVLAALLVPPPAAAEIEQIRAILAEHNPLEEASGGLYDFVDELTGEELIERVRSFPEVRLAPHADSKILRQSIERLMRDRSTATTAR